MEFSAAARHQHRGTNKNDLLHNDCRPTKLLILKHRETPKILLNYFRLLSSPYKVDVLNNQTKPMEHIVIIGNGIAGVTAARHIRKLSDKKITIVSAESKYFFSRTALMYVYMGHMKFEHTQPYENHFWKKNGIDLVEGFVDKVDTQNKLLKIKGAADLKYDKLIIATGSKPNKFGWPGQDLDGVQGLYSKQDLELLEENAPNNKVCKRAVIVGGGLIGIELAEMLRTRNIPVTFLVRETSFWNGVLPNGESEMINEHIREHHIDLRLGTSLKEIIPDENNFLEWYFKFKRYRQ